MNIIIELKSSSVELFLKKGSEVVDKIEWKEDFDLSQKLLLGIDEILVRNNLIIDDIKSVDVSPDVSDKLTTFRIAQIVSQTLNKCKSVD